MFPLWQPGHFVWSKPGPGCQQQFFGVGTADRRTLQYLMSNSERAERAVELVARSPKASRGCCPQSDPAAGPAAQLQGVSYSNSTCAVKRRPLCLLWPNLELASPQGQQ